MGYYMEQTGQQKFIIRAADKDLAFDALKKWEKGEVERVGGYGIAVSPPLDNAETLESALSALDWVAENNQQGDIEGLYFNGEKLRDEDDWLTYIAPYVEKGSCLTMLGEDGYHWCWYFDGKTCKEYIGEVVFPQMPNDAGDANEGVSDRGEGAHSFPFMIRETQTLTVWVKADSYDEALERVEEQYNNGEYNLDHNCFAGAEFRPCCSRCKSDFDVDDNALHEINGEILCDRCAQSMETADKKK